MPTTGQAGRTPHTCACRTIEVPQAVQAVYSYWTQFERYPRFMSWLHGVSALPGGRVSFTAETPVGPSAWDARVREKTVDRLVSLSGANGDCFEVALAPLDPGRTRVTVTVSPGGDANGLLAIAAAHLDESLEAFGRYVEELKGQRATLLDPSAGPHAIVQGVD
jgi:uncharacterized membrane protein